jgi:hypothetical protein
VVALVAIKNKKGPIGLSRDVINDPNRTWDMFCDIHHLSMCQTTVLHLFHGVGLPTTERIMTSSSDNKQEQPPSASEAPTSSSEESPAEVISIANEETKKPLPVVETTSPSTDDNDTAVSQEDL